jgi:hypothetical protein
MNKRLLIMIFTGFFLLLAVPLVEAGCGCSNPDEIDTVNAYFDCETLTISWSHSSGIGSAILIVDYSTLTLIKQKVVNSASGSVEINFSPALSQSTVLSVLIIVVDGPDFYISEFDIDCVQEVEVTGCTDGRLNQTLCEPLAVYPVESEDGLGITVYKVSRGSDVGEFALYIPAEVFSSLPDEVAENCTLASSEDGEVVVYLLSSGQYQINVGPDEEGKVFVYIFDDWRSAPVQTDSYISGATPEILPACI